MTSDRSSRWERTTSTRQGPPPLPLPGHATPAHAGPAVRARRRRVVTATGAGAFGLFYGAARLARHIPPLNRAIHSALRYADDGSTPPLCCSPQAPTQ